MLVWRRWGILRGMRLRCRIDSGWVGDVCYGLVGWEGLVPGRNVVSFEVSHRSQAALAFSTEHHSDA